MPDYNEHYLVLGLKPGQGMAQIQRAYRRGIARWHPDRFEAGSPEQRHAEEKTKALNQAYEALSRAPWVTGESRENQAADSTRASPQTEPDWGPGPDEDQGHEIRVSRGRRTFARLAGFLVLAVAAYNLLELRPERPPDFDLQYEDHPARQPGAETAYVQGEDRQRPEEVSHLPSTAWMPQQPAGNAAPRYIRVGSTTSEVVAVLGPPMHAAPRVWDYGPSRIYFKNGLVTGWYDSTFRPLPLKTTSPGGVTEPQKRGFTGRNKSLP